MFDCLDAATQKKKSNSAKIKFQFSETKNVVHAKVTSSTFLYHKHDTHTHTHTCIHIYERLDANKKPTRRLSSRDRVRSSRICQLAREIQTLSVRFRRRVTLGFNRRRRVGYFVAVRRNRGCVHPRDEKTGKSKGFAFVCYLDQRSTILAVDNLNGSKVLGRILRVDHCEDYRLREEFNKKILKWKCSLCGGDNFEGRERCFKCNGNAPKEAYVEVKREEEEGASSSSSSSEDDDEKEEKTENEKQRGEEEEKDEQMLMNELKNEKRWRRSARAIAEGKPLPQEEDEDEKRGWKKRESKEREEGEETFKERKEEKEKRSSSFLVAVLAIVSVRSHSNT